MHGIREFPKIFEEGKIGNLKIKNRIVMAPMGSHFSENGKISRRQIAYFTERAKGGVGLIETENALVNNRLGGMPPPVLRIDADQFIEGHSELVNLVHAFGAKISMQLYHPGRHSEPDSDGNRIPVAPSSVRESYNTVLTPGPLCLPRELTLNEIYELIESFGSAARRARHAGYDAVEIHGAHGYLVHQFISPHSNVRSDIFGGSIENRMRFPVEIIKDIKRKAGHDFPVIFRMTAEETTPWQGYTIADAKIFAKHLENAGADAIHVSMGSWDDKDGISRNVCPMSYPQGWRLPQIESVKKACNIPVIGVGVFREPELVHKALEEGKTDFIALGRQLLADPYWVKKTAEGKTSLIRKCISCNYCISSLFTLLDSAYQSPLHCAINFETGRELDFPSLSPATLKKKVIVVGSGPAGMEAARVAAQRGHQVAIYEKGKSLGGGQLALTYVPPHKQKMKWVSDFLIKQIEENSIEVHLNTEVTVEMVAETKPDVIIVATGAKPLIPDIPGINKPIVCTALDVLSEKILIQGEKVVVLGQYSTGAETAEFLAEKGNKVIIVARSQITDLAKGAGHSNQPDLVLRLNRNKKITILNGYEVREIRDNGIMIVDQDNKETLVEADKVVLARGMVPVDELGKQLRTTATEVYIIGDAFKPRDIASAIYEGSMVARSI